MGIFGDIADGFKDGFEAVKDFGGNFVDGLDDAYSHTAAHLEKHFSNKGNDLLIGNGNDNFLYGGGGNDTIQGMGGRDVMDGGAGWDTLDVTEWHGYYNLDMETGATNWAGETAVGFEKVLLGNGQNVVYGTTFSNEIHLGGGHDRAYGKGGHDKIIGGYGDDTLKGDGGDDHLEGGRGNDQIFGGADDDFLSGGRGNDWIEGGTGNDTIQGGAGRDRMDGGDGIDTLDVTEWNGSFNISMSSGKTNWTGELAINFEHVTLGDGENIVTGTSDANFISLAGGDDKAYGYRGSDVLTGGKGDDTLDGGRGNDTLVGGMGDDDLTGGHGEDTFYFGTNDSGLDRITDFEKGEDVLNFAFNDADDMGDLLISNYKGDTLIDYGNGKVLLEGFDVTEVDTTLFDFG